MPCTLTAQEVAAELEILEAVVFQKTTGDVLCSRGGDASVAEVQGTQSSVHGECCGELQHPCISKLIESQAQLLKP
jgi:hypothetical protein